MLSVLKWLGVALLATVALVVVLGSAALASMDWNGIKPMIADRLSAVLGREISIEGGLSIDPSLEPRVSVEGIKIANASWAEQPYMAEIERLAVRVDVAALVRGNLVIADIDVDKPRLLLEKSEQGKRNWAFLTKGKKKKGKPTIPIVEKLQIDNGELTYRDLARDTETHATLDSAEGAITGAAGKVNLQGSGKVEDAPYTLSLKADSLKNMEQGGQPHPVFAKVTLGESKARVDGAMTDPLKLKGLDVEVLLEGPGTEKLASVLPVSIPKLPEYRLKAHLEREGQTWSVDRLTSHLGETELDGQMTLKRAEGIDLQASGELEAMPYTLDLSVDSLGKGEQGQPVPVFAEIALGESKARVDGSMTNPRKLEGLDAQFLLEGPGTEKLASVLPVSIPKLPEYRLKGQITRAGKTWSVQKLSSRLGESELDGQMTLDRSAKRRSVKANLSSPVLDLRPFMGGASKEKEPQKKGPLVSDKPIDFGPLRKTDADIRFDGKVLHLAKFSLEDIDAHVSLQQGNLHVQPLEFGLVGGRIKANTLQLNAREQPIETILDIDIQELNLKQALQKFDIEKEGVGTVNARIELNGSGRSPAAMLGSAGGSVEVIMEKGRLDQLLVQIAGQDISSAIGALAGGQQGSVNLRCLIADFDVTDGVMKTKTLLMDTANTKVLGDGTIDLGEQKVDLKLLPRAKDFSLLSSQAPVHVTGGFQNLSVKVDKSAAIASLATPIELGVSNDADCQELAKAARQQ